MRVGTDLRFNDIKCGRDSQYARTRVFDTRVSVCYHLRVKLSGCLLGSALTGVLGVIWKILKFALEAAAKAVVYFGLYFPIAYLVYGFALFLAFDFPPFGVGSVDGRLYVFGFALSLAAAAVKTVRSAIVKPLKEYFNSQVIEYDVSGHKGKNLPEAPRIYKSRVNPGVIVYEYGNRYDLYEEYDGGLVLVKTEWKTRKR